MTPPTSESAGLRIARRLALAAAETWVRTPPDKLPFDEGTPPAGEPWPEIGRAMSEYEAAPDAAAARLHDGLKLSWLECWLVFTCGAVERYPEAATAIGIVMDETHAHLITPIAFARLMASSRGIPMADGLAASLGGGRPARRGLLESRDVEGRPHTHQPIRLATAEFAKLLDGAAPQRAPAVAVPSGPPAFEAGVVRLGVELLKRNGMLCVRSLSPRAARQYAVDVAGILRVAPALTPAADPRDLVAALRVHGELPIVDLTDTGVTPAWRVALADAQTLVERLVVLVRDAGPDLGLTSITVPRLGWTEAQRIWQAATSEDTLAASLATTFRVSAAEARAACRFADDLEAAQPDPERTRQRAIQLHLLDQGAGRMGRLVSQIKSEARLEQLILPDYLRGQVTDILSWHRSSPRVFGEMGLGRRTPLGRGLTCLFSGPPGTGKTFAAQCIANELSLNLYQIDLSQVVSKYIGETEKALATVFDEAEAGHGVLLFDEADALFGKRSEVKDAHDRYANIEVGYLLQRLDAFDGIAILATNLRSNLDPAFIRRMRFLLDFPMPDAGMRRRLWEQSLPAARFRDDGLELEPFAERFRLSGGSIQNVGLAASHMAADATGKVGVAHLVRATYRELEKTGHQRDRAFFGALGEHLPREVA